jgi:hypothetical protein
VENNLKMDDNLIFSSLPSVMDGKFLRSNGEEGGEEKKIKKSTRGITGKKKKGKREKTRQARPCLGKMTRKRDKMLYGRRETKKWSRVTRAQGMKTRPLRSTRSSHPAAVRDA